MIYRILRGGPSYDGTWFVRSTYRYWVEPEYRYGNGGFRLVVRREP